MIKKRVISKQQLQELVPGGYLFAILDACDSPAILEKADEIGSRAVSLFRGTRYEHYSSVAPYLLAIDSHLFDWIFETLSGRNWGIFILTKAAPERLYQHLQRFLAVQLPDGGMSFFRYYDPRILPVYLQSCQAGELIEFCGPIRGFAIRDEHDVQVLEPNDDLRGIQVPPVERGGLWRIRTEQYRLFEQAAEEEFRKRLTRFLRENVTDALEGMPEDRLSTFVEAGIARARKYGMTWESSITSFVAALVEISPDFDRYPPFHAVFTNNAMDPNAKMQHLITVASEDDWEMASTVDLRRA